MLTEATAAPSRFRLVRPHLMLSLTHLDQSSRALARLVVDRPSCVLGLTLADHASLVYQCRTEACARSGTHRPSSCQARLSSLCATEQNARTRCVTEVNVNVSNCVEIDRNDFGTETGRNVASWHTSAPFRTILLAAARWGLLVPFRFVSVPFWYI